MNKKRLAVILAELLSGYYFADGFLEDMKKISASSGNETSFISLFSKRLVYINTFGKGVLLMKDFEILKDSCGLCSMIIKSKNTNARVLFRFTDNDEVILLTAFFERYDSFKYSYDKYIRIANIRYESLTKGERRDGQK